MADIVELQYVTMLSNRLDQFKVKHTNPYKVNFRCPICGDSQKSKYKTRGWLNENPKDGKFYFNCFNCHAPIGKFPNFLKAIDMSLYNSYVMEKYKDDKPKRAPEKTALDKAEFVKPVFDSHPLKKIKKLSSLKVDHPAKKYIEDRQIPHSQHYRIYYAPKFMTWINGIIPNKFKFEKDEPRIVLPFLDKNGNIFGCSARGFNPNGLRYITIMFYEDRNKIFGIDQVDFNKPYSITEGGFDSLFLSNAVAMAGADGNLGGLENLENATFIFDNEPRNKQINAQVTKLINKKQKVCIWPENIKQKDINDMYLAGVRNIEEIIEQNTFQGLDATLKLSFWRKT